MHGLLPAEIAEFYSVVNAHRVKATTATWQQAEHDMDAFLPPPRKRA
jgi:hypothetical protein